MFRCYSVQYRELVRIVAARGPVHAIEVARMPVGSRVSSVPVSVLGGILGAPPVRGEA